MGNVAQHDLFGDRGGFTYVRHLDLGRLNRQARAVWDVMAPGAWLTLCEIKDMCGEPEASISARLRDFRKEQFGRHDVSRRRRGEGRAGVFEYRLQTKNRAVGIRSNGPVSGIR